MTKIELTWTCVLSVSIHCCTVRTTRPSTAFSELIRTGRIKTWNCSSFNYLFTADYVEAFSTVSVAANGWRSVLSSQCLAVILTIIIIIIIIIIKACHRLHACQHVSCIINLSCVHALQSRLLANCDTTTINVPMPYNRKHQSNGECLNWWLSEPFCAVLCTTAKCTLVGMSV